MRKSNLKKNHEPFDSAVERYRTFAEKIVSAQRVVSTAEEKRDIAESVLLRLCAHWEQFIDEHLVDCVNRDHSQLSKYFSVTIPDNPPWDLCHALIIGSEYTNFRSFGDLKGYSKKILPEAANPFLKVSAAHSGKIDEVYKIRNYLSHYSKASQLALHKVYRDTYRMERFLEPGQFLLAYKAKRFWSYFDAFAGASADMKASYTPSRRVRSTRRQRANRPNGHAPVNSSISTVDSAGPATLPFPPEWAVPTSPPVPRCGSCCGQSSPAVQGVDPT